MKVTRWLIWGFLLISLLGISHISAQDEDDLMEDELLDEDMEAVDDVEDVEEEETPAEPVERPVYVKPVPKGPTFFCEAFDSVADFEKVWMRSKARKDEADDDLAKYDGKWSVEEPKDNPLQNDLGLVLKSRAKHHAVSAKLTKPFDFTSSPLVVQYEVKFQNGQECGGAYVKLLSDDAKLNLEQFHDKSPYTIMFGPDKCGNDNKLHFIFRHKNPKTGVYEEKHAKKPSASIDSFFTDKKTHLFTLVVNSDNTFEIFVDQNVVNSGNLLEDMDPPVNPPKEITDPNDKKPADWDEREKIPDPEAVKPDDWDETLPEMIPDPDAVKPEGWLDDEPELIPDPDGEKPEDWDDDMDGEWEAPMINNPACESAPGCGKWEPNQIKNPDYKGKWKAPMIENPNYKGKWKPRIIANPDFFEDKEPFNTMTPIGALGLELWSMSDDIYFDNFIITSDKTVADQFAADSWELKNTQELNSSAGKSVVQAVLDATNERPWLWAVFIVVVVLPIVLVIAYCCMPGSKPDEAAKRKKTDEPAPDDEDDVEDDEEEKKEEEKGDEGGSGDATANAESKKSSKGDLEAEDANEADAEDEEESEKQVRSSPRKRKVKPQKE